MHLTSGRPSWYDIKYLGDDATRPENQDRADDEGVLQSVADINAIIAKELEEVPDVPSERIVVGGFSQGAFAHWHFRADSLRRLRRWVSDRPHD
jgi:predicted esterase